MNLHDAVANALATILAHAAPDGTVAFVTCGYRDGTLVATSFEHRFPGTGVHPDVVIRYAGDSYDLEAFGENVCGRIHTLPAVLRTRLLHRAACNPANA